MKPSPFSFALTADQVASRSSEDRVPRALAALAEVNTVLAFERTAGDEVQALLSDPDAVVAAVLRLTQVNGWRIGIGLGAVESPLPSSTRAARGSAYLAARTAIEAARRTPTGFALRLPESVTADGYGELHELAHDAEAAIWLLRGVLARRSQEGWELMDLLDQGLTKTAAAQALGISPSAVSQRLAAAGRQEGIRGAELCVHLLQRLQRATASAA